MNAQETRAEGWRRDYAAQLATAAALARERRETLAQVGEHAATIAAWTSHIPAARIPARVRLALAELQRLGNAPARPPEPRSGPNEAGRGSPDG